jgi:hypothetical protein
MTVEDYVEFLSKEYLQSYVAAGGASVRLVVPGSDEVAGRWHSRLAAVAAADGFAYVGVDAATTRVHLIDQVYAEVARRVDLDDLARRLVLAAYDAVGLPAAHDSVSVAAVAARHDLDPRELARSVRRQLEISVLRDTRLLREFRLGLLRLAQAHLGTGDVEPIERDAVLGWLRVEPVPLRALRSSLIFARVTRHNARAMLTSLLSALADSGSPGLVLDLDLARLAVTRRPSAEERAGHYYTKAAVLDAFEVVRQLLDAIDTLRNTFVAVALPPELVADETRGLPAYDALRLRVIDEVRDQRRANPFAALMRLETRMEVAP